MGIWRISFALELQGLLACKTMLESKYASKKIKDSCLRALPTHIHTALQEWALVTQEEMALLLDYNLKYDHYWIRNTAARIHLNNDNPVWLRHLASAAPEANWKLRNVGNK
eukprot:1154889-Pelagomonas_calceolata.AAC.2